MMQQYLDIKASCQDALLMFRLGDFYELFFEDAVTASATLDITLTGREAGEAGRVPMCGVPFHALEQYLSRLVEQGYKVAVCDQVEDPKATKGLVKRDIVRIVTPGTWLNDGSVENRFIAALAETASTYGIAVMDVATGEFWFAEVHGLPALEEWLSKWEPVEVVVADPGPEIQAWAHRTGACLSTPSTVAASGMDVLAAQFAGRSLQDLGLVPWPAAAQACRSLLQYVRDTQKSALAHVQVPRRIADATRMRIDTVAARNLELTETARGRQRKGSLLGLLDQTETAMGARLLRRWLEQPLAEVGPMEQRLDAVEEGIDDVFYREAVRSCLAAVYDLDRLLGRLSLGSANARDLLALGRSLACLPDLTETLLQCQSALLNDAGTGMPNCTDLAERILLTLVDQPPVSVREGGFIRAGIDERLDAYRSANVDGKAWLAALEQRERDQTTIKSLKVGYNKVFGYFIEVSKSNLHLVPDHYERRQTLASAERFVLPEMKEREALILQAEERQTSREYELFLELREAVLENLPAIQEISTRVATIDVLQSLSTVAAREHYVRPVIRPKRGIQIWAGRHPVVEAARPGRFVPNDVTLTEDQHFLLITGPNMAGKSTYMRQTALIVIMAHIGSFVPADAATIGIVDQIFTRIGASDDLAAGQSTFMVEMVELAQILRESTDLSLVLLDEIGRGTSTYDGLSIAEAVMEALNQPGRRPLTLFATHYHELTLTATTLPGAANLSVLVEEDGQDIRFLHAVVARPADKSYGIQVARLAGLPNTVIERALELNRLRETSADGEVAAATATASRGTAMRALPLFSVGGLDYLERVAKVDVNELTPLAAMNLLAQLVRESREELGWA